MVKRWKEHMAIPSNLDVFSKDKGEQEKILRYLLLRVLINQQARFEKVREISIRISEEFTDVLLSEPFKISESELFKVFKDVAGEKGSSLYRVGVLGGIKPISLFSYRFKAYEGFIRWLNENKLNFVEEKEKEIEETRKLGESAGIEDMMAVYGEYQRLAQIATQYLKETGQRFTFFNYR